MMKKDFYFVLTATIFFLILSSLRLGPQVVGWRRLAFYLIHPTAGTFISAYEHASHIGRSWRELFESRKLLEEARLELEDLNRRRLLDSFKTGEPASEKNSARLFSLWTAYRGIGEKLWSSMVCVRPASRALGAAPVDPERAVLQFSQKRAEYVLAGKVLPLTQSLGGYPCVELITSDSYAVAVDIVSTGESAVVRGMNRPDLLSLEYLSKTSPVKVGDAVKTSSVSFLVPPGILVGEVVEVEPPSPTKIFMQAYIRPYLDLSRIKELALLAER